MRKTLKWGLIGAAVAAVIAAIIAVVLVLVLKKNGDDPGTSERVMYFAIHLGDNKALHRSKYEQYRNQQCSIDVNVDNTRKSITAMKDVTQKYSFILFSDTIETTAPMSNEEAIAKLDSIKSKTQGPLFSQESVVKEFERRSGKQNRLVYYIPCSFDYSHHDEDVRKFVEAVRKAGLEKRIMVVSNTRPAKQVSDLYQLDNVAGSDTTDIVQKIMEFGHQGSEETTLEPAQTSMKPKTSTIRKTTKTTTRRSSNPTRSTDHTLTPKPRTFNCIFVGDNFNYGSDQDAYEMEADLITGVAHDLFASFRGSSIGLWAYGHTRYSKDADSALKRMRNRYNEFVIDLKLMKYHYIEDPLSTAAAIEKLNQLNSPKDVVDCLVFFSAQQDVESLPMLHPLHLPVDTVVAVGLNNTDLYDRVHPSSGIAVSVPIKYADSDVQSIIDAITKRIKPTRRPTTAKPTGVTVTTKKPTTTKTLTTTALHRTTTKRHLTTKKPTTTAKPKGFNCLFVGDNFNFGDNQDDYETEADLIANVAHDLWVAFRGSSIGLWAYGHTRLSKDADSALKRMRKRYNEFIIELKLMKYHYIDDPLSTADAIKKLNRLNSSKDVVDCLVFFSAQQDVESLPVLNPVHLPVDTVVAVGLNNTDLSDRVHPSTGVAISVPIDYEDSDVKSIVDAITKRTKPTKRPTTTKPTASASSTVTTKRPATTKTPATTVVPSWIPDCLVIGDLFNYGHDEDAYEQEGELIDAVAYELFESTSLSSLGLWAFGYTSFSKRPSGSLEKMRKNYDDFQSDLVDFDYVNISDPLDIKAAIDAINAMRDNGGRINCLVLFSPLKDTTGVPSIEPVPIGVEKVVGVGLNNVNLEALLPGNGLAVKVPRNFLDEHVSAVVNAIISRPQPITTRITTTEPSFARRDCIFVGDLFNYGNDTDSYDQEMNFISDLVYDFLDPWYYKTTAGFWAYGYTNFSKSANTSLETMTKNYYKFNEELLKMEYFNTTDPWTTKEAIEELNRMYVSGRRANCIVFFSAQKNTTGLPQINPKNMDHADRVIAVGIDTDLRGIVPYYGQAVRIPLYYRNDYVYRVLTAIMEQPPPTQPPKPTLVPISTEQTPTSTQTTSAEPTGTTTAGPRKSDIHCVLAGDMLNIRDRDTYDREAYFMKKIGARLFETTSRFIAGVWSYGYSRLYEMWLVYDTMTDNYMAFSADVNAKMYSYADEPAKITTDNGAISFLNEGNDKKKNANCLIFLSATQNATGLITLNPTKKANFTRIVAVSLRGLDLSGIVVPPKGVAVKASLDFTDQEVSAIVDAVKSGF